MAMLCSFRNILVSRGLTSHFRVNLALQCHQATSAYPCPDISFPSPQFDYNFLMNETLALGFLKDEGRHLHGQLIKNFCNKFTKICFGALKTENLNLLEDLS